MVKMYKTKIIPIHVDSQKYQVIKSIENTNDYGLRPNAVDFPKKCLPPNFRYKDL